MRKGHYVLKDRHLVQTLLLVVYYKKCAYERQAPLPLILQSQQERTVGVATEC